MSADEGEKKGWLRRIGKKLGAFGTPFAPFWEPCRSMFASRFLQFVAWFIVVIVVGLAATWLPVLISGIRLQGPAAGLATAFERHLYAGTLVTFCIPLLAEGIAGLFQEKAESNRTAVSVRAIASAIGLLLVIVSAMILMAEYDVAAAAGANHIAPRAHVILAAISLLFAMYLYCFRLTSWEHRVRSVDEEREAAEEHVRALGSRAVAQNKEGGVAL